MNANICALLTPRGLLKPPPGVLTARTGVLKRQRKGYAGPVCAEAPIALVGTKQAEALLEAYAPIEAPTHVVAAPPEVDAHAGVVTPVWTHDEYHANTGAVSCSVLKKILRSPAHMKAYQEEPNIETNARLIGTALHAAVLEPSKFASDFVVWTGGDRRGVKYNEFVAGNPGKSILKTSEYDDIVGMRDAIMGYKEYPIGALIAGGINESSIVWVDKETQVQCKVRPDNRSRYGMSDLKTTDDARPYAFIRQCVRLDYDLQAYMYTEGEYQRSGKKCDFYFIAVETSAPYSVWVHQASAAMLASGELKFRKALALYAECRKTGDYPGYEMPCSIIEWPKYA